MIKINYTKKSLRSYDLSDFLVRTFFSPFLIRFKICYSIQYYLICKCAQKSYDGKILKLTEKRLSQIKNNERL